MTLREFLADGLERIMAWLICIVLSAMFLAATGTQTGVILILFIVLLLAFGIMELVCFVRQRIRLRELEAIMDQLDQKYLFAECVPGAKTLYERRLFELMHRAGRAMIGAVSDAQAAQREYREYVEGWVHEIKTTITAAGLICRNADNETRRRFMQELGQIEAYVERTLFYARAESPEKDFVIRQVQLSELAAEAIDRHRALLMQSGVRVETLGLERWVFTDDKWAVFILGQLLQNAARYRKRDPVVTLRADLVEKQVHLTVEDNGIGIPAHELSRVFDRGFTGSNGRSRGGSTGMGLYLCRRLADSLGLGLWLISEEGEGTAVTLVFPAKEKLTES